MSNRRVKVCCPPEDSMNAAIETGPRLFWRLARSPFCRPAPMNGRRPTTCPASPTCGSRLPTPTFTSTTWDQNTIEAKVITSALQDRRRRHSRRRAPERRCGRDRGALSPSRLQCSDGHITASTSSSRCRARARSICAPAMARSISPDFKGEMDLHSGDGSRNSRWR